MTICNSTNIIITVESTDFGDKGDPKNWSPGDWTRWNNTWYPYVVNPMEDIDDDGFLNYKDDDIDQDGSWNDVELAAGTDPTDPLSFPGVKKQEEDDTKCTLLIVLVIIFAVVLLLMIVIFSRGKGGHKGGTRPTRKEKDFF